MPTKGKDILSQRGEAWLSCKVPPLVSSDVGKVLVQEVMKVFGFSPGAPTLHCAVKPSRFLLERCIFLEISCFSVAPSFHKCEKNEGEG